MTPRMIAGFLILLLSWIGAGHCQNSPTNAPRLIIRCDDIGFCHGANMAFKRAAEAGTVSAVSVIVNGPWLDEAVEILNQHPEVSVGVHLTLNSEWRNYKWGPVAPVDQVSSLVDPFGKFFGTRKELFAHRPKIEEVAKELRAQVDLAKRKGLKISYIDNHMGAAISTLEFQEEMEKIAKENHIGISRYFGEQEVPIVYSVPPEQKLSQALKNLDVVTNGLYLLVCHVGTDGAEMQAMSDSNASGPKNMARHRQAEADVLCSAEYKAALQARGIKLVGYDGILKQERMRRPFVSDRYEDVAKKALEK